MRAKMGNGFKDMVGTITEFNPFHQELMGRPVVF